MAKIVFDIGGTNMRVAAVEDNRPVRVEKVPTPKDPSDAVNTFETLAQKAAAGESIEAIAGGIAGVLNTDGSIHHAANLPQWGGSSFVADIGTRLGVKVSVANDADLAGLGEAVFGAGRGQGIVMYIGAGTGIGGTRIVNEKIDAHAHGFEPGSQIIDAQEKTVLESLVSGSAITRRFNVHPKDLERKQYDELTLVFAVGLHNSIVHWSPDVVVLGGSLMNEDNGYRVADIKQALESIEHRFPKLPELKRAELKDEAGLYGGIAMFSA